MLTGNSISKLGGDSYYHSKTGGIGSSEYEELVEICCFLSIFSEVYSNISVIQGSYKDFGKLTEIAWAGAAFNLFLYPCNFDLQILVVTCEIFGAFWYLFSIERETTCWKQACVAHTGCFLFCDDGEGNSALLSAACPIQTPNTTQFNFGIFLDALQSGVVESTYFPKKFFYCFWWGPQNLRFDILTDDEISNLYLLVCYLQETDG
ncbi:hypothetical protein Patl1_20326 [Pistacia atlantica]|uniref:Uncharacterized protein n=1 Tax=Pistacia atlantica TaxID=434234 RepID=A0ACC1BI52_9ROSI|nr:hypothetical protein Patl1_20326 [Pistacia atlantica]